jgi:predicted PurR-regulated permease PerM
MKSWIIIIIVCLIVGFLVRPVDRLIEKKVSSKWLAYLLQIIAYFLIFLVLYGIVILIGFNIWK